MLNQFNATLFIIILCRIACIVMFMPTIGVSSLPRRIKVYFAIMLSIFIMQITKCQLLPPLLDINSSLLKICVEEALIGALIGSIINIITNAANVAGGIISSQSGLSSSALFDPVTKSQSTSLNVMINCIFVMMIFASNAHLLFIQGMINSYDKFPISSVMISYNSEMLQNLMRIFGNSLVTGLEIAAPCVVGSIVLILGAGILARLMPKLHILFVMLPVQIVLVITLLLLSLSGMSAKFLEYYVTSMNVCLG